MAFGGLKKAKDRNDISKLSPFMEKCKRNEADKSPVTNLREETK